jgi:hypothetical protein
LLWVLAACGDAQKLKGAPAPDSGTPATTDDAEGALSDAASGAAQGGSTASGDSAVMSPAPMLEAGANPDAGIAECAPWTEPHCEDTLGTFTLHGTTPNGAATAIAAAVEYVDGFTPGTGLLFYGEAGGRPFVFSVMLYTGTAVSVVPPDSYEAQFQDVHWRDRYGQCQYSSVTITTIVTEHDGPNNQDVGAPVDLSGGISVTSDDWQLQGEFHILQSCGWDTVI